MRKRPAVLWLLGVTLIAAGAAIGWAVAPAPLYAGTAAVYISPTMPIHRSEVGEAVIPLIDSSVTTQVALLQSREVIESATASREWAALGRGTEHDDRERFFSRLSIQRRRGEQVVSVTFHDEDPAAALIGVRAVLDAFARISDVHRPAAPTERVERLRTAVRKWEEKTRTATGEIRRLTQAYEGREGLDLAFTDLLERQLQVTAAIEELSRSSDGDDARLRSLRAEAAGLEKKARELGRMRAEVARAVAERDNATAEAANARIELDHVERDASSGPRITIVSRGALATAPDRDARFRYAALGALAGGLLFGLFRLAVRR